MKRNGPCPLIVTGMTIRPIRSRVVGTANSICSAGSTGTMFSGAAALGKVTAAGSARVPDVAVPGVTTAEAAVLGVGDGAVVRAPGALPVGMPSEAAATPLTAARAAGGCCRSSGPGITDGPATAEAAASRKPVTVATALSIHRTPLRRAKSPYHAPGHRNGATFDFSTGSKAHSNQIEATVW